MKRGGLNSRRVSFNAMILATRIYGHDDHRLKVAVDREAPTLKEAGWKLHRQENKYLILGPNSDSTKSWPPSP